jgi:hypothetical protein
MLLIRQNGTKSSAAPNDLFEVNDRKKLQPEKL